MNLNSRWLIQIRKLSAPADAAEALYQSIEEAYGAANRHYHNLSHLEFMFTEIDREKIGNPSIEFATWYHDIVYKPGSRSNERKSADIARKALSVLGAEADLIDKVDSMIMATQHHACDPCDETTALFLDVDMAILGTAPDVYRRYVDAIRKEVRWLPDFAYRKARTEFLVSLSQRDTIFLTPAFQVRYEKQARENIDNELVAFKSG